MKPHDPSCPKHHCHAATCGAHVKPELLMCARHWRMVPSEIQQAVWRAYRVGQCDDKLPSAAWHDAADAAICTVAHQEYSRLAPPHRRCRLKDLYETAVGGAQ